MFALPLAWRLLTEVSPRLLWALGWNFAVKGIGSVRRFQKRRAAGVVFPAFLMISVTDRCNLSCQGCWVTPSAPPRVLPADTLEEIITRARSEGCTFFGLLGGEPLLYPPLWEVLEKHPDCYFQVFTNGTLLTAEVADQMRRLGNVTPLISIEGLERVSDERRGGHGVYRDARQALAHCHAAGLFTGVATSVCRSNYNDLVNRAYLRALVDAGAHYLWYYIYRPVGPRPCPELALDGEAIRDLRRFLVESRSRVPLILVDAYWDAAGKGLCPAATGISAHIAPGGEVEPCPVVQFATESVTAPGDWVRSVAESDFLQRFRSCACETGRGCILLDAPARLAAVVQEAGARDTTGRGTGMAEIAALEVRPSHVHPGPPIPEQHWAYRLAKKYWFFGFGAYG